METPTDSPIGTTFPPEEQPKTTYSGFVASKVKSPDEIIKELNHSKAELIHYSMGIASEAGELLDAVKKHTMYNKELDRDNVIEELGDLEFYMQAMRLVLGVTREQVIQANVLKLSKRYVNGFSNRAAIDRADKTDEANIELAAIAERRHKGQKRNELHNTVEELKKEGSCESCGEPKRFPGYSYCLFCLNKERRILGLPQLG